MPQIIPTAEPFFFPGNKTGVLLIHGFTGAPKEMRWMGEYLHRQGYTVLGIRLAGHATRLEDMLRVHWQDWLLSVEDGYNLLRTCTDRVFLAGLSMGGVLSLTFAGRYPAAPQGGGPGVQGVIAMSAPYKLPDDPRLRFIKPISWFMTYMPKGDEVPGASWFDKASFAQHVDYPTYPLRAIGELKRLMVEMRETLPQVKVPVLLIHSRNDETMLKGSMQNLYDHLGSADKQMLWVENSGHVITEEPQRELVFQAAADFIRRVSTS